MNTTTEEKVMTAAVAQPIHALEIQSSKPKQLTDYMAEKHHLSAQAFLSAIRATVFKEGTNEQLCAFLMVAQKYELDPILKEIYAFPAQGGGIIPIVSIDGWYGIANKHPQYDGVEFDEHFDEQSGKLHSITAKIYRKDRSRPTAVTEYYGECSRDTVPWKKWPVRMLRHKAFIQCCRIAFSLSGVYDPDEASRIEPSLGPVIDATEYGGEVQPVQTEQSQKADALFAKLQYTDAQAGNVRRKYANQPEKLIEWLEAQVAKKQADGSQKPEEKPAERVYEPVSEPEPPQAVTEVVNAPLEPPPPQQQQAKKATPPKAKPQAANTNEW